MQPPANTIKGRGTALDPPVRFEAHARAAIDDGWDGLAEAKAPPRTQLILDQSRSVISYNQSPDIPFDRSINPYRGCEHGCVYCFARPTHAYLGYSPGLDFETKILHKPRAAQLLREELARPGYRCQPIALGVNTDAYQPVERRLGITRSLLEVLLEYRHPVTLITKSGLISRDLDLLGEMARLNLVMVAVSVTSLDRELSRRLEPRAAAPYRRLETIERLAGAGIPTHLSVAPVIPMLTEGDLEQILVKGRAAGARSASYLLLRLPHEVKALFRDWLANHAPHAAARVMSHIRHSRGGRDNDPRFGSRMRGTGEYANLLRARFDLKHRQLGYGDPPTLDTSQFRRDPGNPQLKLL